MKYNKESVDKILDAIFPIPEQFGVIASGDFAEPIEFFDIRKNVKEVDANAKIYYGMTKLVILPSDCENIVIKIPFNGLFEEDPVSGELDFYYFYGAAADNCSDYCLAEYEKYTELKAQELECFVAETICYRQFGNMTIILQERITPEKDICFPAKPSKLSSAMAKSLIKDLELTLLYEREWVANCIDCYGYQKVKEFLTYCEKVDPDIVEDAHDANYGYRKDKTLAFLDFSNFAD